MIKNITVAMLAVAALAGCKNNSTTKSGQATTNIAVPVAKDVHTLSNADSVDMQHLDLDIAVDMARKQISGNALWTINNKEKVKTLKLDTYDLSIDSVLVDSKKVAYKLDTQIKFLGSALHIPIAATSTAVRIYYHTGADARALQWLDPQQTHDKQHPFLYTQSESIYARSWIPCADGPGIRFTYTARVKVPKGLLALMSASNPQDKNDSGIYHFNMELPIPAYLMALAVGDIAFKAVDERTVVFGKRNSCKCIGSFAGV